MRYPFKHLAAYERDDNSFYFGRDTEKKELHRMTFETDLILVYGASGVGKSSLISCGLANEFESYEWYEISVRRGNNINDSLIEKLNKAIGLEHKETDIIELIRLLRRKCFKPVYLIFDQFEELFIIRNDEEEQQIFYANIKKILSLNQPVKIIISVREEFLGYLYDFEKEIPQLFSHKCWIQPSKIKDEKSNIVDDILKGIDDIQDDSFVSIQDGDRENLSKELKKMFQEAGHKTVDLPTLQILFDEFYISLREGNDFNEKVVFSIDKLEKQLQRNINAILWDYIERIVKILVNEKKIKSEVVWGVLLELITEQGTKKAMTEKELIEKFPEHDITLVINFFKEKAEGKEKQDDILNQIKRNEETYWELRHDALAKCILDKLSEEVRLKNLIRQKTKERDPFIHLQLT